MSRLNLNLHQDFQPASREARRNLPGFDREPLSSQWAFLLSAAACLAGLLLVYMLL
jgi:hypothetical protein